MAKAEGRNHSDGGEARPVKGVGGGGLDVSVRTSAWYAKKQATFSDALAAVRRYLWEVEHFQHHRPTPS